MTLLVHRNEKWCAFVLDQKDEEFRGFRIARIFSDEVNACRVFVKRVPRKLDPAIHHEMAPASG